MMQERKSIFFDIDGTLCAFGGQVPESTKEALKKLKERGHLPVVCTGRPRCTVFPEITDLDFSGIIAGAGTYIEYKGEILKNRILSYAELNKAMDVLERYEIPVLLEGTDYMCYNTKDDMDEKFPILKRARAERPHTLKHLSREAQVGKITIYLENRELLKHLKQELSGEYTVIHYEHGPHAELVPKGLSKAQGIADLISHLHISRENTYAFGDGPNDLEMLQYVQYGVAMGNSESRVLQAAKYQTERIEKDGIKIALEQFGLI